MYRFLKIILIFFILSTAPEYARAQHQPKASPYSASMSAKTAPKLVVGIVVDQMRYEYIPRFWDKFGDGGFKRLVSRGFNFSNNHFNYVPTYTGPGHAAIYTGTTPSVNGIVGNNWYVRKTGQSTYVVADSLVQTVGARDDAGRMSPRHLLSTTVTDELKSSSADSKIIGVSIKDRAAILPAGHLADGAYWYDDHTGHFITSSWYKKQLPDWVLAFNREDHAQKLSHKTWKPLMSRDQYSESNADDTPYEGAFEGEEAPVFPHRMNGSLSRIKTSPFGNTLVRQMAEAAVQGAHLGQSSTTDFLAISFSSTDYVGHRFGPHSIEVEDTYLRLDRELAGFLNFLDQTVGHGNYVLFLTADHGAVDVPASLKDRGLPGGYFDSDTAIDSLGSFLTNKFGKANWIKSYVNRQVYLNHSLFDDETVSRERVEEEAARFLRRFPGVATVGPAHDYKTFNYTRGIDALVQNGFYAPRSGDVIITLKPGWLDSNYPTGTSHGSPYSYDTHVPLIFYGRPVPHGRTSRKTVITQLAPTISAMFNITFPSGSANHPLEFKRQ